MTIAQSEDRQRAWSGRSKGGDFGHAVVAWVMQRGWLFRSLFLLGPSTWFFITEHHARRCIVRYWKRQRSKASLWEVHLRAYLHFIYYAHTLADRFVTAYLPDAISQKQCGSDAIQAAVSSGDGCVLLSAHLGNWDMASRLLSLFEGGPFHLVVYRGEDPQVQARLDQALGDHPCGIIDLADPQGASIEMANALSRGEICCIMGDRGVGHRDINIPFLGSPVPFPTGPCIAAATTGAWIVPSFAVKTGYGSYQMLTTAPFKVTYSKRSERNAAIEQAMHKWVRQLERVVQSFPSSWMNFHDYWGDYNKNDKK